MAEFTSYKDTASSRHLRFKLQSLSRRLDELEEATKNLQKAEDELLDLQDKVIQAEGSNSSMLAEIEVLRQRVLRIEGKDEEIKRAEDLCQLMKEKLEEEENLTRELKSEIERLQKRMAELEKLEEAFSRSKNDCTQLCLSLNEERNLTKKISSELEMLRVKVKELESSEDRLDKTEQGLVSELEKLKSLTLSFVSERKHWNEKEKENEKLIRELTQKLEQNKKINRDYARNASNLLERNDLRIEDGISSTLPSKESRRKGALDYLKQAENETRNKSENEKNRNQEDNKVKDLNQEIEKLKTQIKHFESLEEELKKMRAKNNDLQDNYLSEQNKNKLLASQLEEIKLQIKKQKELENGEVEGEDAFLSSRGRHERTKLRGHGNEASMKHTARELSPQHKRERHRNRELALNNENPLNNRQVSSPSFTSRRAAKASHAGPGADSGAQETRRAEDRFTSGSSQSEGKKSREQPSVLSRYPPAAQEHNKGWKGAPKPGAESGLKGKVEKATRTFSDNTHGSVSNDVLGRGDKASDTSTEAPFGKRGHVPGSGSQTTPAADSGSSKAVGALATSRRSSSEGLSKGKKAASGLEADTSFPSSKTPPLSKYPYSSRSQENILQGFSTSSKEGVEQPVAVVMEDSSQHEALRCRVTKSSGREKPDSDDDMDVVSLVTAKLVNTTITPEPEPPQQPHAREKAKSRGVRASLFENDKDVGTENESGKAVRASTNAMELPEANGPGAKSQRPFSPREALRSRAIIKPVIIDKDVKKIMGGSGTEAALEKQKSASRPGPNKVTSSITIYPSDSGSPRAAPGEAPRERHTSTGNIQVGLPEPASVSNHVSAPFELSIHKHDITLQFSEAERTGDGSPKNRPETVVSRSSIIIKPSDPVERSSHAPTAETIRWKSHSAPSEAGASDARHVTVRNAWKSRRDVNSSEDSPGRVGKHAESPNLHTQRSSTDCSDFEQPGSYLSEQGTRRSGTSGDAPELACRRTHSSLTVSEVFARRSRAGDAVPAEAWNHSVSMEEGDDCTLSVYRRLHNSLERSELSVKQGPTEPGRTRAEERLRPTRPCAEDN
ncbi:leucine zipper protein 1 isoform X1 [Cervus elaphus]|uniref:leucine zipper protein 1 isoform X1 n=1 Tax=Cervus elaphus TaxID=9860 RepID=UPI001CC30B48|nr:leucine zipper protein 1 isoform X1 [Cervus elaphus]XP_043765106.1 leucine zipper protein 1 isoform X1 [Cervus elaphus]XP_043765107.1 leucine zipper protein 1 isoform X1 [Cervus elaphus]XP_043765108.1 leucine zipper protein 1 isoform X1 [Cervus elaphus]XP_043765109.1 leucine zipper protein 1 isoform X1 [Cervus elaphus]XP_043765110.1 leucine zipper protein 1 isoform X1 [Cervus elaphus]XP_043765112.1 leucine zipper protein 1 isoform X1 [Cervus elaphus]XP_043765113.1 leucine zipper protein 1